MRWGLRRIVGAALLPMALAVALPSTGQARIAYVANAGSQDVSVLDTRTGAVVSAPIAVEEAPTAVAITPDGRLAFVANHFGETVSVIDTQANQVVGDPIDIQFEPNHIGMSPDGKLAYVTSGSPLDAGALSSVDVATRQVVGEPLQFEHRVGAIAIAPDGRRAYVLQYGQGRVLVVDLQGMRQVGQVDVGSWPLGIAITPDGSRVLVSNNESNDVSVIDTASGQVAGPPIGVGSGPRQLAISPDGRFAYVANHQSGSVSVIDIPAGRVVDEVAVGDFPTSVTFSPMGDRAYVTRGNPGVVRVIDTSARQLVGQPIGVGAQPESIAIVPNQGPVASFSSSLDFPTATATFDGGGSVDPDGRVTRYDWSFGDGWAVANGGSLTSHGYAAPGSYPATLQVADNEGCSTTFVFTGQTAYCNGSRQASQARIVTVPMTQWPAVRLRCPKRAKGHVCRFEMRAVATRKKRSQRLSAPVRARVKRGAAKTVRVFPNPRFASRLAHSKRILFRGTRRSGGFAKHFVRWFRVAHG